ncbi:glutamate-5-semialdehyde dehydrogenase [Meiothermus taiwanensis]|jgi:glutamate-5-semialdehyde dehydrogenase|uniref:Gamma-glutamyl phosphate reductase n=2 Tax=Meiothermus taiwanensis TaxID=172827 RepID=A0A399E6N4_9DEIN|nr:glutamate-5-semialdehyde dehydrogenase [Meiothermus taiwanensis]AWR87104.1 gamma-glutamyl phosphate reductase [Meiothermus taiwanensis WR-220]KIQ55160.1 gamma-glutamyl phosphate reductase [Meiothermus taiwanensis]KZK17081.1 gamma-glutamyl-phosphate reductase [Meiothermus taiwanensis]RIH79163.1 Gamma-glutamyl phosphate reductase [Meiothermus taiwanensis]
MTTTPELRTYAQAARAAARALSAAPPRAKNTALLAIAAQLQAQQEALFAANRQDLEAAQAAGLSRAKLDRLRLDEKVLRDLRTGLQQVAEMPDPVGEIEGLQIRPNGLQVGRMRVPLGVIGFIYESRPNATVEASALCLKAGNAILLRGGKEAWHSNRALVGLMQAALQEAGLPREAIQLVPTTDRSAIVEMCHLAGLLDLIIPRGGKELIELVQREARMPVLAHAEGVNHLFVDESADLERAVQIALNGKAQRPSTCNSLEKVLVHQRIAPVFLPLLARAMQEAGVELRGDEATCALIPAKPATPEDWQTEYLDLILTVKVVDSLEEAIEHIARYGSHHTEVICTNHHAHAMRFLREVDASLVLVNASPRFNDGFQLGLGAEIGISTSKLHAYGPMGVRELTTTKFVALGSGQVRD